MPEAVSLPTTEAEEREFIDEFFGFELSDDDISAAVGEALSQLNVNGDPIQEAEGKSLADHIACFTGGDEKLQEQLLDSASGITSASKTKKSDSWARKKYEFVQQHRLRDLPANPWKLVLEGEEGRTTLCAALCTAIAMVVYDDKPEGAPGAAKYEDRRLPASTILQVVTGWNRLVRDEVRKASTSTKTALVDVSIIAKTGSFVAFHRAYKHQMKLSAQKGIKLTVNHYRPPSDEEYEDILRFNSLQEMQVINGEKCLYPAGNTRKFCFLGGCQLGWRGRQDAYNTRLQDFQVFMKEIRGVMRAIIMWNENWAAKTNPGDNPKVEPRKALSVCPTRDGTGCCIVDGRLTRSCTAKDCIVRVYYNMIAMRPPDLGPAALDQFFLAYPAKRNKNQLQLCSRVMGEAYIGNLVIDAIRGGSSCPEAGDNGEGKESMKDLCQQGFRARLATMAFKNGVEDKYTMMQTGHREVTTLRHSYQHADVEGRVEAQDKIMGNDDDNLALMGVEQDKIMGNNNTLPLTPATATDPLLNCTRTHVRGFELSDIASPDDFEFEVLDCDLADMQMDHMVSTTEMMMQRMYSDDMHRQQLERKQMQHMQMMQMMRMQASLCSRRGFRRGPLQDADPNTVGAARSGFSNRRFAPY